MLKWIRRHWFLSGLALLLVVGFVWVRYRMWGPYRSYRLDVAVVSAPADGGMLEAGVARRDITPKLDQYDTWVDADQDGQFNPRKGDTYVDRNRNGTFDLVWLGGFDENRPAQGINDPLWTRAIAFRQGGVTLVMVTIDSVGLTAERFVQVRKSIDHARHGITHILFSTTHTHNGPDTMGIWSYRPLFSKFDQGYLDLVLEKTREAVLEAVANLQPVDTVLGVAELSPEGYVRDSRKPEVLDRKLCAARFMRRGTEETLATLVSWGNHPEAFGGDNPLISSDFPHYLRETVEKGLAGPGGARGVGGICLYFQGPVGGLMTPLGLAVPDRNGRDVHKENGLGKVRALGENVGLRTLQLLAGPESRPMKRGDIAIVARTLFAPIEGTFKYPIMLGLLHPGWYDGQAKSEIDAVRVGEMEILTVPGELYPEISEGGVEVPEGSDFGGPALEEPPFRSQMKGRVNMVFNLANDEIGYLVPHSQWDRKPPFTYGRDAAPYGEVNSGGPDVATVIHREGLAALKRLHELLGEPQPAAPQAQAPRN